MKEYSYSPAFSQYISSTFDTNVSWLPTYWKSKCIKINFRYDFTPIRSANIGIWGIHMHICVGNLNNNCNGPSTFTYIKLITFIVCSDKNTSNWPGYIWCSLSTETNRFIFFSNWIMASFTKRYTHWSETQSEFSIKIIYLITIKIALVNFALKNTVT